jgi:UDP-glucose 4-epimerase
MRILITGGNGYVGRPLTRLLLSQGLEICIVDSLRCGYWRFSTSEREQLRLERLDIRDDPGMRHLMSHFAPDVVIHLAATHYIPECEQDPVQTVSVNVLGTLSLLQICPEGCRFVLASSGAVYQPDDMPHREDQSAVGPNDIYGFSKLQSEEYLRYVGAKRGLRGVIVRLFNVIGPGETNPHLFPELVAQLKAGRKFVELGNLSPRRDYISVRDAARGFCAAALGDAVEIGDCCTVNLGTSETHSVAEVIAKLRRIADLDFEVRHDASRMRRTDRPFLAADIGRIRSLFGWRPLDSTDEALTELWNEPDLEPGLMARYR